MFSKMLVSAVTATALLSTLPAFARDLKLADFHSPSHFIGVCLTLCGDRTIGWASSAL